MRKKKIFIFMLIFLLIYSYFPKYFSCHAEQENDYLTYQEITMSSGKLIKNITKEEYDALVEKAYKNVDNMFFYYFDSQNVEASYIAETTELIENNGLGTIERKINVVVETNKKVTFSSSGSISSSSKFGIKNIKNEITGKAGVEYSKSTTKSVKEINEFIVKVEPNSQYMVVVEGRLRISNGAVGTLFPFPACGLFEIVTLESQFYQYEVRYL